MADWGVIKKAVNSKPNTMPLDKMLGAELLRLTHATGTTPITVSGVNGFVYVATAFSSTISMTVDSNTTEYRIAVTNNTGYSSPIVPVSKNHTYNFSGTSSDAKALICVYQLGGVFLKSCFKAIKRLIHSTPSSRRVVLA